jgi:hypothetical protein
MPALNDRQTGSRRTRVLDYFKTHPGFHRCRDVAEALGEETHPIAVAARNLMLRGDIERIHGPNPTGAKAITMYGIPADDKEPATP